MNVAISTDHHHKSKLTIPLISFSSFFYSFPFYSWADHVLQNDTCHGQFQFVVLLFFRQLQYIYIYIFITKHHADYTCLIRLASLPIIMSNTRPLFQLIVPSLSLFISSDSSFRFSIGKMQPESRNSEKKKLLFIFYFTFSLLHLFSF